MSKTGNERTRVLVADDDAVARKLLSSHLGRAGYETVVAADGAEAQDRMSDEIDVALLDLYMPKASGLECLQRFRERFADAQVIVLSAQGGIEDAVEAMKRGAFQYLAKPVAPDDLIAHVRQAERSVHLARDNRGLREAVGCAVPPPRLVARSARIATLVEQVRKIAGLDSTVLISGESGTGKTTLARRIHQSGPRAAGPFVSVSCAALPRDLIEAELFGHERGAFTGAAQMRPGRAEMAHGGTLFLDEIGDLPLELQPKLLTFLQDHQVRRIGGDRERRVDVRVIAATHLDLEAMCAQRRFRQDLYFRLNVLRLEAPPLRERAEDLADLIETILARIAAQRDVAGYRLEPAAAERLRAHPWPGNLRELENVLERASAFADGTTIPAGLLGLDTPDAAPTNGNGRPSLAGLTLAELERRAIEDTLRAHGGNKAATARALGVCEKTIYNKLKRMGL